MLVVTLDRPISVNQLTINEWVNNLHPESKWKNSPRSCNACSGAYLRRTGRCWCTSSTGPGTFPALWGFASARSHPTLPVAPVTSPWQRWRDRTDPRRCTWGWRRAATTRHLWCTITVQTTTVKNASSSSHPQGNRWHPERVGSSSPGHVETNNQPHSQEQFRLTKSPHTHVSRLYVFFCFTVFDDIFFPCNIFPCCFGLY